MKIHKFRFKITTGSDVRILTVGVQKDKEEKLGKELLNNVIFNFNNQTIIERQSYPSATSYIPTNNVIKSNSNTITNVTYKEIKYIIDYSFAYAITSIVDIGKFNVKKEDAIINGRLESTKYSQYDCEIPSELDNYQVTRALAKGYARTICNTVISKLADVKDKKIEIEEYILNL